MATTAERVMTGLGVPISDVGVLKNVRALGELAVRRQQQVAGRAPVIGADETEVKLQGKGVTVGFLTDAASGQIVGIELLSSREGEQLGQWLAQAAQAFGAQVVVTDDLASYADFAIRFRESAIASACGGRSRPSAEDSAEALVAYGYDG